MSSLVERIWIIPAAAVLLSLVLLTLLVAPGIGFRVSLIVQNAYETVFWATPFVGAAILLGIPALKICGLAELKHPKVRRAMWLAGLALCAPVWLLGLQILLSGFAR